MTEKIEVNGDDRHEIYRALVETPNEKGEAGDVTWNFEKFLVDGAGSVVARFSPARRPRRPAARRRDRGPARLTPFALGPVTKTTARRETKVG